MARKTLKQIRSSIINELVGGYQVDDSKLDKRLVEDKIQDRRAALIEDYYRSKKKLDISYYQTDCCIPVTCEEVMCDGRSLGIWQYVATIPELMTVDGDVFIKFFGLSDQRTRIFELPLLGLTEKENQPITSNDPSFTRISETKVVIDKPPTTNLKYVCMTAILTDPLDLTCIGVAEKQPYPIPETLITKLEYDVVNLLRPKTLIDPDEPNNARDDLQQPSNRTAQ